jgi:hypothetical protein
VTAEATSTARGVRSHAFGIDLVSEVELIGLPAAERPRAGVATEIEVDAENPLGPDPTGEGEELRFVCDLEGRKTLSVRFRADRGYLLTLPTVGSFRVRPDGLRVTCLPEPEAPVWRWQRALVNQVLPLTATLRGFEVLHSGAVALDGHAVAIVGHPGAGKSSTTLNLLLRGAGFLTDDALAIEHRDGALIAHPGAAVSNFPRAERERMESDEPDRLGVTIADEEEYRSLLAVERECEPLSLGALYFLRRGRELPEARFERLATPDPTALLSSTYVLSVRSPARLANQLAVCAAIANQVPVFDLLIPNSVPARDSARALMEHACDLLEPVPR